MADIYVYAPGCTDFDNMGECGSLIPSSCIHTEIKNGMSEIELVHPIDEMGKWTFLQNEYILVAEVPVRQTPEISDGNIVTSIERWTVKTATLAGQRKLYSKASDGKVLTTLKGGSSVAVVAKGDTRYKVKTKKYTGWIAIEALQDQIVETIANDPNAIQTAVPPWSIRPQRFRIYKVEKTDEDVTVLARHIFYDHQQNITTYTVNNPTCIAALAGLIAGCTAPNDLDGRTNLLDQRAGIKWEQVGFTDSLLAPDTGLVSLWGAELVRDNDEFAVLKGVGSNRGIRIEYGKNLVGVELTLNHENIVTWYIPRGQNSKGGLLLLYPGTYYTNHGTIVIATGQTWIAASNAGDYSVPHVALLDTNVKAVSEKAADIKDAREALIDAALDEFETNTPNYPKITLNVDFVQIGYGDEYSQYRELENVFLYDWVTVYHPKIGIDVLAQVTEYAWDVLRERADKITLGNVNPQNVRNPVPLWQLPKQIPGYKIGAVQSLSAGSSVYINEGVLEVALPGSEDGEFVLVIGPDGTVYAPNMESPTVAGRLSSGGIYTVGTYGDFEALADVFAWLDGKQLSGDITLKLTRDDPGGALRGVTGGYAVRIMAANLYKLGGNIAKTNGVTTEVNSEETGIIVTATEAGTWKYCIADLGSVDDLGIEGMQLAVRAYLAPYGGTTQPVMQLILASADFNTLYPSFYSASASTDLDLTYVPSSVPDGAHLGVIMFVSRETACEVGAKTTFWNVSIEVGTSVKPLSAHSASVADLDLTGCAAQTYLANLVFPDTLAIRGSNVTMQRCGLYGATGVTAEMARLLMRDCSGSCTQAVRAKCAQVYVTGKAPSGLYTGQDIDTSTAVIDGGTNNPPTETVTSTLVANLTGSYVSSGWIDDQIIRQGYTSSRGRHRGYIRFDLSSIPSGATVSAMKLTLKRNNTFGISGAVTVKAYGTPTNSKSGGPTMPDSGYVIGTVAKGRTGTFDLPSALVAGLANGTYKGICLYSDDTTVISGNTYSENFAGFEGTDATAPKLAVTYTV